MPSLLERCVAELFGSFVLCFCACGCAGNTKYDITPTALSFGLTMVGMAYSIGRVSGCHINPAVSLAYLILGQLDPIDFLVYVLSQFIGGLIGALAVFGFMYMSYDSNMELISAYVGTGANSMLLYDELGYKAGNTIGALLTEIVLTFIYVYVFINASDLSAQHKDLYGFIVGGMLTLVNLTGIRITGASINPARSLATAVSSVAYFDVSSSIKQIWIWIIGPMIGGGLAPFLYKFLHNVNEPEKCVYKSRDIGMQGNAQQPNNVCVQEHIPYSYNIQQQIPSVQNQVQNNVPKQVQ